MVVFEREPKTHEHQSNHPMRVLVVEPDQAVGGVIGEIFSRDERVQHVQAHSGEEALETLREARRQGVPFDLVMTGDRLPGEVSGFTVAQAAAGESHVVFMTSDLHALQADPRVQSLPGGAVGFLPKPITVDALDQVAADVSLRAQSSVSVSSQ